MNLNEMATDGETDERLEGSFSRQLPKVELNAHLNGSLTGKTLMNLGCSRRSIALYEKLSKLPPTSRTLQGCSELFEEANKHMKTPKDVYIATKSVIEDFVKDNVVYLELRTTPKAEDGMSKEEYIEAVVQGIEERESKALITVKLILSIDRTHSKEESKDSLKIIIKMRGKYADIIKCIHLSGDPNQGQFDESLFEEARNSGLCTTIPCGEITNDLEVERILRFRPDRISHGTSIHPARGGSLENYELYLTDKIPIECCLTSNVICGQPKSYWNNPVRFWTVNQPFAICTGNKGVFGTTLSREYAHFQHYYGMKPTDLWQVTYDSVRYSFASEEEKLKIGTILTDWLFNYSASLKFDIEPGYEVNAVRRRLDVGSNRI